MKFTIQRLLRNAFISALLKFYGQIKALLFLILIKAIKALYYSYFFLTNPITVIKQTLFIHRNFNTYIYNTTQILQRKNMLTLNSFFNSRRTALFSLKQWFHKKKIICLWYSLFGRIIVKKSTNSWLLAFMVINHFSN